MFYTRRWLTFCALTTSGIVLLCVPTALVVNSWTHRDAGSQRLSD